MKKIDLLGAGLEPQTVIEYQGQILKCLGDGTTQFIVTPNPEMLVASERDPSLKDVLNQATLRIVDGFGIVLLSGFRLYRWPGVDVLKFLALETNRRGLKMLLAGGMHAGDAEKAASSLRRYGVDRTGNDASRIVGYSPGTINLTETGWVGDEGLKEAIERERPDVLALALGHGKQEKWLFDHLRQFPFLKLGIGVGGALEFYAGRQIRAPRFFRQVGLEWLYRLFREPHRVKRIFTAVVIFPTLVFLQKIKHTLFV